MEDYETPIEALTRELKEELDVELIDANFFGRIHEVAVFEEVPLTMDLYTVQFVGVPAPHSEIAECLWIDRNYGDVAIELSPALERELVPRLLKEGLM